MNWTIYWTVIGVLVAIFILSKAVKMIAPWLRRNANSNNGFIKAVAKVYWPLHEANVWADAYDYHRRNGASDPALSAHMEIVDRAELLRFSDYASDAYLEDGTDLEEAKTAFIKDNYSAKNKGLSQDRKVRLRAAIRDMPPEEAYDSETLRKYRADLQDWARKTLAEAEAEFGKGGYSPLERRVLRGNA